MTDTDRIDSRSDLDTVKTGGTFHYTSPELMEAKARAKAVCREINDLPPDATKERTALVKQLFGACGENLSIKPPFYCDYGFNLYVGNNVLFNYSCVFLDAAPITIGDNTLIGPMTGFYAINHDMDPVKRNEGLAEGRPITVGKNVWIGGSVTILPGVTIGDNAIIGAGSVVTKDIPADCVAAGNPARVIRHN